MKWVPVNIKAMQLEKVGVSRAVLHSVQELIELDVLIIPRGGGGGGGGGGGRRSTMYLGQCKRNSGLCRI